jgi:hypothetical protein
MHTFGTLSTARTFLSDETASVSVELCFAVGRAVSIFKARPPAMTMKRTRFVEDAKLDPGRYYRNPSDIIRDRRLSKEDRLEIVIAWEQRLGAAEDLSAIQDKLGQLQRLRAELQQSPD